ncbi:MAG: hypothetical protein RRY22_05630 [Bacilli bacterium]
MKIVIENYKNIKKSEFEIEDKKINYIFGISGSGKSSIANGLSTEIDEEFDKMIGSSEDVKIMVDDKDVDTNMFSLYSEATVNDLVLEQTNQEGIYKIIFGDTTELKNLQAEYHDKISKLIDLLPSLYEFKGKMATINKEIGGKLAQGNKLPKTAKINRMTEELKKCDRADLNELEKYGSDYIQWKIDGTNFEYYSESICPFCKLNLTSEIKSEIEKIKQITPKTFTAVISSPALKLMAELGVEQPTDLLNETEIENYKIELVNLLITNTEIDKIIDFIYIFDDEKLNPSELKKLEIDKIVYNYFPKLESLIDEKNLLVDDLKPLLIKIKQTFSDSLKEHLKIINEKLNILGIPYRLKKETIDTNGEKASYILKHKKDITNTNTNRTKGLSYGEKNILSLLLFLLIKDNKTLILDDPVSSYDEYRRKVIFDMIHTLQENRTILVLSHDQVFTKFALYFSGEIEKIKNKTGKILNFNNYSSYPTIQNISKDDFKPLNIVIKEHIKSLSTNEYYRKILNIRLLTELEKYRDDVQLKCVWEYTSAILHFNNKETIDSILKERSLEEDAILELISRNFDIEVKAVPDNYKKDINTSEWTNFEKAMFLRENTKKPILKDELNNIAHLNDAYMISLNPYKYDYFSPYVYEQIQTIKEEIVEESGVVVNV